MWSVVIEVSTPCSDELAGMTQVVEQVFVEAFIPHTAIEAFDEAVLHWFSRSDVVPVDFAIFLPLQDRI